MKEIVRLTFWWRIGLLVVGILSTSIIGFLFPYPNFENLISLGDKISSIWAWGGFDGTHYLIIAESGYIANYTQAFFPVFPWLIRVVSQTLQLNSLYSGLLVSNISLVITILLFWKLARIDYSVYRSRLTIYLLLLFPTSFYLGAVYGESTFLVLVLGSFLAARKKRWLLAGILGAIASATRPVGIFLLPALLVENWLQWKERGNFSGKARSRFAGQFSIFLVPIGLVLYMIYLNNHFSDPLKFLHSQPAFGADRSDKIILLYQVFWRYAKMVVSVDFFSLLYYRVAQELLLSLMFLVLGIVSLKKTRLSYAVFAILSFLTPTLTGTFSSMPRYVLVMFPGFMLMSGWLENKPFWRRAILMGSSIFLIINTVLFLSGRFLA